MRKSKLAKNIIDDGYSSEYEEDIEPKHKANSGKTIPQNSESQKKKGI